MSAVTAISQAQAQFFEAMPTLRTKSPQEVRQFLVDQATSLGSTGDPVVDTVVQSKLADGWSQMLATHMKEHIKWQQEDMVTKQVNMNVSAGSKLQAARKAAAGTGWSDQDQQREYADVITAAAPAPGQDQKSWSKGMISSLQANLQAGNFDYYNAIKGSKLWGQIDPVARTHLDALVPLYVQRDAANNPAIHDIKQSVGAFSFTLAHGISGIGTTAEFNSTVDQINAAHQQQTGSPDPLINNTQRTTLYKQWLTGLAARQTAVDALKVKEEKYTRSAQLAMTGFNSGNPNQLVGLPVDKKGVADAMDSMFDTAVGSGDVDKVKTYFDKASIVASNSDLRSPKLTAILTTQIPQLLSGNGPLTGDQASALNYARLLLQTPNGPAALSAYLGKEAPKVVAFIHANPNPDDPKQLETVRQAIANGWVNQPTSKEIKAVQAYVVGQDTSLLKQVLVHVGTLGLVDATGTMNSFSLSPAAEMALGEQIAPQVAMYQKAYNLPLEEAAQIVLADTLRGADMVPGAFVPRNAAVATDQTLTGAVNRITHGLGVQSTTIYQDALKKLIDDQLTAHVQAKGGDMGHFDPDDYEVRSGVQMGHGMVKLFLWPKDMGKYQGGPIMLNIGAGKDAQDKTGLSYYVIQAAQDKNAIGPAKPLTPEWQRTGINLAGFSAP
jgi:hypothetical protein